MCCFVGMQELVSRMEASFERAATSGQRVPNYSSRLGERFGKRSPIVERVRQRSQYWRVHSFPLHDLSARRVDAVPWSILESAKEFVRHFFQTDTGSEMLRIVFTTICLLKIVKWSCRLSSEAKSWVVDELTRMRDIVSLKICCPVAPV